jgi:hypothetical protein
MATIPKQPRTREADYPTTDGKAMGETSGKLFVAQPNVRAVLRQLDAWLAELGNCDTPALRCVRRS